METLIEVLHSHICSILQAQGKYQHQPPFPFVLGTELAGRIAPNSPIPPGCPYNPGDRVFGAGQGAYAERTATEWRKLHPVPRGMSYDQAAGLFVTYPTSYEALVGRAALKPGEWVLVHAAAGGVGLAAVQIAKALGAKVIATAGSPSKLDVAKRLGGADEVLNYRQAGKFSIVSWGVPEPSNGLRLAEKGHQDYRG